MHIRHCTTGNWRIAASTAYFFAKIPVTSKLGDTREKWAECLMKGNTAVYYGLSTARTWAYYEKVEQDGAPASFGFRENLPEPLQKSIAEEVMLSRTEGLRNSFGLWPRNRNSSTAWRRRSSRCSIRSTRQTIN